MCGWKYAEKQFHLRRVVSTICGQIVWPIFVFVKSALEPLNVNCDDLAGEPLAKGQPWVSIGANFLINTSANQTKSKFKLPELLANCNRSIEKQLL